MENKNLNIAKRFVEFLSNKLNPKAKHFAGIKGKLTLNVFKDGELIETMVDNNLIVNAGQSWVMNLLKNDTPLYVEKIRIGSSSIAATVSDTNVTGFSPDFTKNITAVVTGNVCSYNFTIDTTEANGNTIAEYGLLLDDNTMIARVVKTPIPKNSTISIEGNWEWSIYFNNEFTV